MSQLLHRLHTLKQRRDLKQVLEKLQQADRESFDKLLLYLCRECHISRPVYLEGDRLREAEGRRKLGMGILQLLAEDDPQHLINRIEKEAQDERNTSTY